jgi:hypothetical protein
MNEGWKVIVFFFAKKSMDPLIMILCYRVNLLGTWPRWDSVGRSNVVQLTSTHPSCMFSQLPCRASKWIFLIIVEYKIMGSMKFITIYGLKS